MTKISLDIDGVLANFNKSYLDKYGTPKNDLEVTKNVRKLKTNKDFWLNLPVIHKPNFTPKQYTTARIINKDWIKEYLYKNGMPKAPVYQIYGYGLSKASKIRMGGCEVHVDDSLSVFIDLNLKGIPCLLMDSNNNQNWGPIGRVFSLDIEEIEETYYLFKSTMFDYFNDILDEYRRAV